MKTNQSIKALLAGLALAGMCTTSAIVLDFEDFDIAANTGDPGPVPGGSTTETENPFGPDTGLQIQTVGDWESSGVGLSSSYSEVQNPPGTFAYDFWNGFAISNVEDTTTPGNGNQYAAITGGGFEFGEGVVPGSNYGIVYNPSEGSAEVAIPSDLGGLQGVMITNTTYAYLAMQEGDGFAKEFAQGDWFQLYIIALDEDDNQIGTASIFLADFRSSNSDDHYILEDWEFVRLDHFGDATASLRFQLYSSDNGDFGMNTPAYFAVDNLFLTATAFGGAEPLQDGWNSSEWFGEFYDTDLPWIYHETLGWLYLDMEDNTPSDIWMHSDVIGWFNTAADFFPWIYDATNDRWLYYVEGTEDPWLFYDETTGEIIEL